MPELPELEALRIRLAPRLTEKLITATTVNPKKAHLLRYPVDNFALELPARSRARQSGSSANSTASGKNGGDGLSRSFAERVL